MSGTAMPEFAWPDPSRFAGVDVKAAWPETVRALPVGTRISGEVIGRRPFGVFLGIDGHPAALGLAKINVMPDCGCLDLPQVGERVMGAVVWHADRNCEVHVQLSAWAEHPEAWPRYEEVVGRVRTGTVTMPMTPLGIRVRIDDCVEGFIRQADLPSGGEALVEGREVLVRVAEVDLVRHHVGLTLV